MNRTILTTLLAGVATLGFASATYAADLIVDAPEAPMMSAPAGGNWDGAYIGAFAGYGWGTLADETNYWDDVVDEYDMSGWQLGLTAGANFTLSESIVAGIAGDIAWANISGAASDDDFSFNTNWTGSIRGRLGFDGGAFLPYVTAGLAFANNTISNDEDPTDDTQTHIGWTVGAGVEFAVADNVSIDLQYRYSDYGSKAYTGLDGDDHTFGLTSNAVTVGLNWRF